MQFVQCHARLYTMLVHVIQGQSSRAVYSLGRDPFSRFRVLAWR